MNNITIIIRNNIDIGQFLDNILENMFSYDNDEMLNHVLNESLQSYNCFEKKPLALTQQNIVKNIKELCTICQCETTEEEDVVITECKHFFHKDCIDEWVKFKAECPVCKTKLAVTEVIP